MYVPNKASALPTNDSPIQGYPIFPWLANPRGTPRLTTSFYGARLRTLDCNRVNMQVGNAMSTPVCTAVLLFALAYQKRLKDEGFSRVCESRRFARDVLVKYPGSPRLSV